MNHKKTNLHFIPNTHLDREWTMDFQHSRKLTVNFLDSLLDIMDKVPEYKFLLDAQAVPLEDYLEIRPQNKERLSALVQSGRLNVGPWYSALDMNTFSGEAVLRNLLYGHTVTEQFGPVMNVGYTPFGWGQMSQLPQLYRGFGIDMAFFYRGITNKEAPRSEFIWKGADGSEILVSRFGCMARYNFYIRVWRPSFFEAMEERMGRRYHWKNDQTCFKLCDTENRYDHGTILNPHRILHPENLKKNFRDLIATEKEIFGTGELAFMHGMDTSTPDLREHEVIQACQNYLEKDEAFFYSSLPEYARCVQEAVKEINLPTVEGEVRYVEMNNEGIAGIGNDIISARMEQKIVARKAENMLVRQAEPFAAMNFMNHATWPKEYLDIAWKEFMKCQPHDTVAGCSIEKVAEDALHRLSESISLSKMVCKISLTGLQSDINTASLSPEDVLLTVYNPAAAERSELVCAYIDIPRELDMIPFVMKDLSEKHIGFTAKKTGHQNKVYRDETDLALSSFSDEYEIWFEALNVPSLGYTTYILTKGTAPALPATLHGSTDRLENEYLSVRFNRNGTIDLFNKETGQEYQSLHTFEDYSEVGQAWTHISLRNENPILSLHAKADIRVADVSPLRASVVVALTMDIPVGIDPTCDADLRAGKRSAQTAAMSIESTFTLEKGSRTLDVTTRVNNPAKQHRLRVLFPSDVQAENSYAESLFDVVERRIARDDKNPYGDVAYLTYPFIRFAGVEAGPRNIAILSRGTTEYEVFDDAPRTLALTLFRSFKNELCTTSVMEHRPEEKSYVPGVSTYAYSLYTGPSGAAYSNLFQESHRFNAPLMPAQTKAAKGNLPAELGMLSISNPVFVLCALKKEERGNRLIIRLLNIDTQSAQTDLTLYRNIKSAVITDLNEKDTSEHPEVSGNKISIRASGKKIITLAIKLKD